MEQKTMREKKREAQGDKGGKKWNGGKVRGSDLWVDKRGACSVFKLALKGEKSRESAATS